MVLLYTYMQTVLYFITAKHKQKHQHNPLLISKKQTIKNDTLDHHNNN